MIYIYYKLLYSNCRSSRLNLAQIRNVARRQNAFSQSKHASLARRIPMDTINAHKWFASFYVFIYGCVCAAVIIANLRLLPGSGRFKNIWGRTVWREISFYFGHGGLGVASEGWLSRVGNNINTSTQNNCYCRRGPTTATTTTTRFYCFYCRV